MADDKLYSLHVTRRDAEALIRGLSFARGNEHAEEHDEVLWANLRIRAEHLINPGAISKEEQKSVVELLKLQLHEKQQAYERACHDLLTWPE